MDKKLFTIDLIAFKQSGKYYSSYKVTGEIQYFNDNTQEGCPYTPDVINLVYTARRNGDIPSEFDYLIQTGVPHYLKADGDFSVS